MSDPAPKSSSHVPTGDGVLKREHFSPEGMRYYTAELAKQGGIMSEEVRQALLNETRASIAPGEDLWVFGYGSLMWNPMIEVAESRTARIEGFHRHFCLTMSLGRGSPDAPGLMLGLDEGGACTGVVHRIAAAKIESELALLWHREMLTGAYRPRWIDARSDAGTVKSLSFVIDRSHRRYEGELAEDIVVARIARAAGVLGTNRDYLYRTAAHLSALGIADDPMHALAAKVRACANEPEQGDRP